MNLNDLVKTAHAIAKEKGWYDEGARSPLEAHMLMVSEVSEATEAARGNHPPIYADLEAEQIEEDLSQIKTQGLKPEGEAVELADVVIRIADYFGHRGWDLEEVIQLKVAYNKQRAYRHGNKKF